MNAKMKVLSLALVGLCGYAGSAMAACPDGADTAHGGAWNSVLQIGGSAVIASPGFADTECRLDSKINAGSGSAATAAVVWNGSTTEPTYRAQFMTNAAQILTSPTLTDVVTVYSATSGVGGAGVRFTVFGSGGNLALGYSVRYDDNGVRRAKTGSVPLPSSGPVHVEFQLITASSATSNDGVFKLWVESNAEADVTKTETGLNNFALTGIDKAQLGLTGPTAGFVTHFNGHAVGFDQYDSRRSIFIGY